MMSTKLVDYLTSPHPPCPQYRIHATSLYLSAFGVPLWSVDVICECPVDESGAAAGNSNVGEETAFSKSRALSSSSRSVSVKYVNELGDGVGGSNASLRSVYVTN